MIALLRPYFATSKKLLAAIITLGVTTVVFSVGLMFVAGYLISASADNVFSLLMLNIPLAFVQIFGLGKPIAGYFERLKSHDWVLRITSHLRRRLFLAVQASDKDNERWKTGEVLASLANDIEQVQDLFLRVVFPVLIAWISGLLLVVIAGVFSWMLLLFALGMMVVLCLLIPLFALALNRARLLRLHEQQNSLYASVTDAVLGAQDVVIARRGAERATHFMRAFNNLTHEQRHLRRRDRMGLLVVQVVMLVGLLVVLWWATARFGGAPGGAADWIVAIALGFFPLIEVFAALPRQFEDGLSHRESLIRLSKRGLLAKTQEEPTKPSCPEGSFTLELDHVSYAYGEADRAARGASQDSDRERALLCTTTGSNTSGGCLQDISLVIPHGQKVALLGKSGSGKTTLARLIHAEFEPSAGSLALGGVALHELKGSIWEQVGYISQDSYVFAMSILDNLRIGKIDVTESEAWAALRAVGLEDLVRAMPEGLESMADEAGLNLSGGQRQRLALARVLLQDPPLVVLDEPTVGLDPVTEQLILDTVWQVFADKTVLFITHHLQGIERFDRVLFLEEGTIIMDDAPGVLVQKNERFQQLLAFDRGLFAESA